MPMNITPLNDAHHTGAMVKKAVLPAFTVEPMEITLRPRTATTFTFRGNCAVPCVLKEVFVLESKIGNTYACICKAVSGVCMISNLSYFTTVFLLYYALNKVSKCNIITYIILHCSRPDMYTSNHIISFSPLYPYVSIT